MTTAQDKTMATLHAWYENERPRVGEEPERYVVCAGLAVLEIAREKFPLQQQDYITERNQVKTSGSTIQNVLKRYGENRLYAREGGRTTRGTRTAADKLVSKLNSLRELRQLSIGDRAALLDELQRWLAARATEYFERQRLSLDLNLSQPAPQIIGAILSVASSRNKGGPVAQHLVGAKLAIRYPDKQIENQSYTTADVQLGRAGDFLLGDTAIHVTVAPMQALLEKCGANLRQGYRPLVIVPGARVAAAQQIADTLGLGNQVWVASIEDFVGQNLAELGEFRRPEFAARLRDLLETYNTRVEQAETDRTILIEIPANLQ